MRVFLHHEYGYGHILLRWYSFLKYIIFIALSWVWVNKFLHYQQLCPWKYICCQEKSVTLSQKILLGRKRTLSVQGTLFFSFFCLFLVMFSGSWFDNWLEKQLLFIDHSRPLSGYWLVCGWVQSDGGDHPLLQVHLPPASIHQWRHRLPQQHRLHGNTGALRPSQGTCSIITFLLS